MRERALLLTLVSVLVLACTKPAPATRDPVPTATATLATTGTTVASVRASAAPPTVAPALDARLRTRATAVLSALKARDMKRLAALAHPSNGVRFSAYSYVDTATDVALTPAELGRAMTDPRVRVWGTHDGKGDPIKETFAAYFTEFVWTHDFSAAPDVSVDREIGTGNSLSNLAQAYPTGHFVELHFPGFDKKYEGMDWESLRLVFEEVPVDGGSELVLVGIVHAEWTI